MRSPDSRTDLPQIGKQLDPRVVFNGLRDTFGDTALCVEDKEWHARIKLLRQAGRVRHLRLHRRLSWWGRLKDDAAPSLVSCS